MMVYNMRWIFSLFLALVLSTSAFSQTTARIHTSAFESLIKGSKTLFGWFSTMLTSVSPITSSVKKARLARSLTQFHKDLFDLESNTSYLIEALSRKNLNNQEINSAMKAVRSSLDTCKTRLNIIGPDLSSQLKAGGNEASTQLGNVFGARGIWVGDLMRDDYKSIDPVGLRKFIEDGEKVKRSLNSARVELIKVIDKVKQ
ncbi:hypothetical protein [Dyadobacter sp. CY351]|uniref:hypothetical protein n=1 Tax=Dyadobacter sp. CY351 TaxID=2909337 RepID=UPI001F1F127B|nr:hypothetical protein [Dyadobacter sp. CY351]MCF2518537.1 hypothetical protein [Dyadobacter sp. CY351]